ncbi:hypothetical protein [Lichenibacterium dinghuense]|uniref:hypothetical protein n=1 Tax=Lichenibacterium dinghuense TaxID=2895977 RepID=UPI001F43BB4C|nr:hypothetical protein [Lichenibacterium sp. 6Y81]
MVSSRALSAVVCVVIGLGCIGSVVRGHPASAGPTVAVAVAAKAPPPESSPSPARPAAPPVQVASAAAAEVDTELPTGSIAPGSAVHVPNPAAYKGAPKMGDPVTVTGAEAINYLAGNTLRREGPGEPLHFTYFASRGLTGEGDERGFTARRWDRERPELCEAGPGGATLCRSVSILLDGIYEFPGARLGTVTLGAAAGVPAATAVLVKGNAMHFPEHIPFLDSAVDVAAVADGAAPRDPLEALAGHSVSAAVAGARGRQVSYYAKDNRRFELQQVQAGDGKAVQVTVGHWHAAKGGLCQARTAGGPQTCFKVEAAAGGLRLVPTGKTGDAQTLTLLPETGAREVAQD